MFKLVRLNKKPSLIFEWKKIKISVPIVELTYISSKLSFIKQKMRLKIQIRDENIILKIIIN